MTLKLFGLSSSGEEFFQTSAMPARTFVLSVFFRAWGEIALGPFQNESEMAFVRRVAGAYQAAVSFDSFYVLFQFVPKETYDASGHFLNLAHARNLSM